MAINLLSPATLTARWTERKNVRALCKQQLVDARKSALFQQTQSARLIEEHSSSGLSTLFETSLKGLPENVGVEFRMEFCAVKAFIQRQVRLLEALDHQNGDLSYRCRTLEEYHSIIKSYRTAFEGLKTERTGLDHLLAQIETRRGQLGLCARKVRLGKAEDHLRTAGSLLFRLGHLSDAKDLADCHDKLHRRLCRVQEKLHGEPFSTSGVYTTEQERSRRDIERLHQEAMRFKSFVTHRLQMLCEDEAGPTVSLRK